MSTPLEKLTIPGVVALISFLSYPSQLLFTQLDPGPLTTSELVKFNTLLLCIWVCYYRSCATDPGRVPQAWAPAESSDDAREERGRRKWCRKCEAFKPPRTHHCKACKRCVPKMDHHCPWTSNCVSHFTFPHFMRFLVYSVTTMFYLEYFLYLRAAVIWRNRHLPSYLGPSATQLVFLFALIMTNTLTLFLVSVICVRTLWALGANVTTIESWEIERHKQLLRRARVLGGYLDGPDGAKIRITRQEFPYDIGIWHNITQGMGTGNILAWLWPFAKTPSTSGLEFEVNGFEDPRLTWPPPDPDRMPRLQRPVESSEAFTFGQAHLSNYEEVQAFKRRQQEDIQKRQVNGNVYRRTPFHERYNDHLETANESEFDAVDQSNCDSGEEGWQDSEGNKLKDFGVDEEAEFYDEEDNIPLSELLRRKKAQLG